MNMKRRFNLFVQVLEVLPIVLLAVVMMAQPAIIFFNYMQEPDKKQVKVSPKINQSRSLSLNEKLLKVNEETFGNVDTLSNVEVASKNSEDSSYNKPHKRQSCHGSASYVGYELGSQAGERDGKSGFSRYHQYDDTNSYREINAERYRDSYEKGYNVAYNASYKE